MANFKIPLKEPSATVDVKSDAEPSTDDRIPQSNAVQSNSNIQTSVPVVDQPQQNPNGNNNIRPFKRLSETFIDFFKFKCSKIKTQTRIAPHRPSIHRRLARGIGETV